MPTDGRIFFSFIESNQIFSTYMQKEGEIFLEYSRIQMIKISIQEKNNVKHIEFSSNILIENKLKMNIDLNFRMAFEFIVFF